MLQTDDIIAEKYKIKQVTNNFSTDVDLMINDNGYGVWLTGPSHNPEICIYNYLSGETTQITDNSYGNYNPQINDNGFQLSSELHGALS